MDPRKPRILVVGAGAVGGVAATLIAEAGHDVRVLVRKRELAERIRTAGLCVTGFKGDHRAVLPAFASPLEVGDPADIILLATKATALPAVLGSIGPLRKKDGVIVSLQNGMTAETIAELLGNEAVFGCVVGWGATLRAAAEADMTSTGDFVIGRLDGREDGRLAEVKEILDAIVPVRISPNIRGHLYAKLIINACITTLGAVSGLNLGPMLKMPKARSLFIRIVKEGMAVAAAAGIAVEPLAKLDFNRFVRGGGPLASLRRNLLIRLIGFKYRRLRSSGLQSLERGEKTEIDALNGYIVDRARERGIAVPVNTRLVGMVKDIENGVRSVGPANFDDPFLAGS